MSNTNSENNPTKKTKSTSQNIQKKVPEKNSFNNEQKILEATLPPLKKTNPIVIVNKDVIRESREMGQGDLAKKEDNLAIMTECKEISGEKATIVEKIQTQEEIVTNLEKAITKPVDAPITPSERPKEVCKKAEQAPEEKAEVKKDKRPVLIELRDKSDAFKKIIDIALAYEKLENEQKKLKEKNRMQSDENTALKDERDSLKKNLEATELLCQKRQADIDNLQADIEHYNEIIKIVEADKVKSFQEFKNALAASLRMFKQDIEELKELDMSNEVRAALIETIENVFKVLDKNGISI